jgi:hypothetical protein
MSIFQSLTVSCPNCKKALSFDTVHSVSADRRPDLRTEIMRGEFQRKTCPACGAGFRLDPAFIYSDIGRGQWVAAQPVTAIDDWVEREAETRALFDSGYGPSAPAAVREQGSKLTRRLVFGWSALREKLIAAEGGIADTVLELLKMAMLRNLKSTPFSPDTTLRLLDFQPKRLLMGWVRNPDDAIGDLRWVDRELYDDIVADLAKGDAGLWSGVHAEFKDALFVDVDRLMVHADPA